MSTNDINLQVINSMTEEKLNSLKDSDGKVPSLANQLIMTDSEDGNLSCLRTEVVYDMTSSEKNLGHPNGIIPSTPVVINANKYDELKVYYYSFAETVSNIGSTSNCLTINLSNSLNNICFADNTGGLLYNGSVTSTFFDIRVQYSKTNQDITLYPFYNGELQSTSMYYISKIEGVLKEPAMIYTGDELLYDITIPPSTTSYTITDLDILKDGGYYKIEIYYPHNNINPTNFFMRINGNTNGGAYVHSYFAHENGNLQCGSQLVNNSPYAGTIGGDAYIAIMNLYLSKAGEIPFWDITNIGYTNHLYYEKFYGYTVASNNITSLTFFHNSVSLGGMKIRIYRR